MVLRDRQRSCRPDHAAIGVADASITLARRLLAGERVWEAHRTHFYQRARDNGFGVLDIVARVFAVNVILALLALASIWTAGALSLVCLALGAVLVGWLLARFARAKGSDRARRRKPWRGRPSMPRQWPR